MTHLRARARTTCQWCAASFETYADRPGKFCSPACRQAEWVARDPERERRRLREYRAKRRGRPAAEGEP